MENRQMSESVIIGILLSLAGGFMDAYSYLCRGRVFANAQTGNILLLGVNFAEGKFGEGIRYGVPIAAFIAGIFLAEAIRCLISGNGREENGLIHWRQGILLIEIVLFVFVCFLPQQVNLIANSVISLACGMQVESFRKIRGNGIATTMCIGNLRSGTENLFQFLKNRHLVFLKRTLLYYGSIFFFAVGAVAGNFCVKGMGEKALIVCAGVLVLAFLLMFFDKLMFFDEKALLKRGERRRA